MLQNQDLKDFSIHSWYALFKDISLKTALFEIPDVLLTRLRDETTCNIDALSVCTDEYVGEIRNAIASLGGAVFAKNNWHAPMDARLFSIGNELRITSTDDLSLYLSVSNRLLQDFDVQHNIPFYIVLKQYKNIHPATEFRCIVVNNILRGITPRDWPTYYHYYTEDGQQIIDQLNNFFKDNVKQKFPRNHYVFDVILEYPNQPVIVDFGPVNSSTKYYAFNWAEIFPLLTEETPQEVAPVFRYLDSDIPLMLKTDAIFNLANSFV